MTSFTGLELAQDYIQWDPNPCTRTVVEELLKAGAFDELDSLLKHRLQFGTAGLRAPMGPGYKNINDLVILQTCQGLCRYLESLDANCKSKGVVIGYDHRAHLDLSSLGFARIAAKVFLGQGYKVYLLENLVHTPIVPFGVQHFGCAAGMMVTASHNPKADNGFKVYWGNGAQIIPPHDEGIAASITAHLAPWPEYLDINVLSHALAKDVTEEVAAAYFQGIGQLSSRGREANAASPVRAAYTAMHGVGKQWILRAFETFGHPAPLVVPQQAEPDPLFPTVSFPNPEEKGALDIALAFAKEHDCSVVIANDPDADRLAVAERLGGQAANTWHVFSGNEIGVILGYWHILQYKLKAGSNAASAAVLASIVSSRMLRGIARAEGVQYFDTLTGFKWLGNKAMDLSTAGADVLFSYEEALGYCCGSVLRDKDGVSAASIFMEIAASLAQGWTDPLATQNSAAPVLHTVYELLQYLYVKYGVYVSYNSYVISRYAKVTDEIFRRIRTAGPSGGYWTHAAGQKITNITDVTKGYDSSVADGVCALPCTPDSHMIMFEFENGASVTLRTSGTEPKIKFYTEMQGSVGSDVDKETLKAQLKTFVDLLVDEMLEPAKNGLQRA